MRMARKSKLKVYRTPIGFHDAYVAAPSQKAALAAWGSDADLFARGIAEVVSDEELSREPFANPGKVIRRLRGTAEEQLAALPAIKPKPSDAAGQPAKRSLRHRRQKNHRRQNRSRIGRRWMKRAVRSMKPRRGMATLARGWQRGRPNWSRSAGRWSGSVSGSWQTSSASSIARSRPMTEPWTSGGAEQGSGSCQFRRCLLDDRTTLELLCHPAEHRRQRARSASRMSWRERVASSPALDGIEGNFSVLQQCSESQQ